MAASRAEFPLAAGTAVAECDIQIHTKADFTQASLLVWFICGRHDSLLSTLDLRLQAFKIFLDFATQRDMMLLVTFTIISVSIFDTTASNLN